MEENKVDEQKTDEQDASQGGFYNEEADSPDSEKPKTVNQNAVEWTANEFIYHQKSPQWFVFLAVATLLLAAIIFFVSRDYVTIVAVVIIGVIFGFIGSRKPRNLTYRLDNRGLVIADKVRPYGQFKSFALGHEGELTSLSLMPLKRFMPILTIYCDPANEEAVTNALGSHLPLENLKLDPIDKFLRKIRF